jgi:phage gpG-like protein
MPRFDFSQWQPFIDATKIAASTGVARMAERMVRHVQESFPAMGKYKPSPIGSPPAKKLGALRDSITYEMRNPLLARVGASIKYGALHEFGGTIRPVTKKFLRVAVNDQAKELNLKIGTQSIRNVGPFRIFKSKRGNLVAVGVDAVKSRQYVTNAAGKRVVQTRAGAPVFLLKPSVQMPRRPFMAPALAWSRENPEMRNAFVRGINYGFKRAGYTAKIRGVE